MSGDVNDIYVVRAERLREVIADYQSAKEFALQYDLNPSFISQLLNGIRPFTEKSARKIEQAAGLEKGSLDRNPLASVIAEISEDMQGLTNNELEIVKGLIQTLRGQRRRPSGGPAQQ